MYNVKFGECIAFTYRKNNIFLLDCGTKNSMSILNEVIEKSIKIEGKDEKIALISHFHADHVNGFEKFINKKIVFDKLYIPHILMDSQNIILYEVAIYLYLFTTINAKSSYNGKAILDQINLSLNLVEYNIEKVRALKKGDNFKVGEKTFEVLWPESRNFSNIKMYKEFVEYAEDVIFESMRGKYMKDITYIINLKNEIIEDIREWKKLLDSEEEFYSDNSMIKSDNAMFELANEHAKKIEELVKVKNEKKTMILSFKESEELNKIVINTAIGFNEDINNTSIVFKDKEERCLFTGDVSKTIINHLSASGDFGNNVYKILKAPHHGTKAYYSESLPKSEYLLISNGGFINWKICSEYNTSKYPNRFCTNGNDIENKKIYCDLYEKEKNGSCKCITNFKGMSINI